VQVVVHDRETADTRGEALGERLQAVFDPRLAVFKSLAAQQRFPNATGHAVVVTSHVHIHELASSRCQR
jgi:hypothetical protein